MMNVYMNRFGEQVETVTTDTLPEKLPPGVRGRKRAQPGIDLVQIPATRTGTVTQGPLRRTPAGMTDKFGGRNKLRPRPRPGPVGQRRRCGAGKIAVIAGLKSLDANLSLFRTFLPARGPQG